MGPSSDSAISGRLARLEAAFWKWFVSQPLEVRSHLAWLYWSHTTVDANDLGLSREEALERFIHLLQSWDFQPRRCVRLLVIGAVFDLFFAAVPGPPLGFFPDGTKVVPISRRQWERSREGWYAVRSLFGPDNLQSCMEEWS